jgi:thiol:disulfide interchange protein DsbD
MFSGKIALAICDWISRLSHQQEVMVMKRTVFSAWLLTLALSISALNCAGEDFSSAQVFAATDTVKPGDRLPVAVKLTVAKGWHTYAKEPGDSGMPPSFTFSGLDGIQVSEWKFPPAKTFTDSIGTSYGYEDQVVLLGEVLIPKDVEEGRTVELTVKLSWMICKDICVFQQDTQTLTFRTGSTPSKPSAEWVKLIKDSYWKKQNEPKQGN